MKLWSGDLDPKLLGALGIGVFMGALDLTILAPALPYIASSYSVTPGAVVLAFSIYGAFYAVSVPLMGKLADVRGYGPVYGFSIVLFAVGSAGAALAPTLAWLVAARVVQGIGGGGLFPVAQALVGATLPEEQQGRVLGLLVGVFALGAVLGPNAGGFIVGEFSWHWIFWINVPLGFLGALLVWRAPVPGQTDEGTIDWAGAASTAVALGSLVLAVESLRDVAEAGFFSLRVGGLFALALAGLAVLVLIERRARDPILDVDLIRASSIWPMLTVSFLVGYALLGAVVFAPIYVQVLFAASAFGSGAVLNAAAGGLGVASYVAGEYTQRLGARRLVIVGMALTVAGLVVLVVVQQHLWSVLVALALLGAGLGLCQGPISFMALGLAPDEDRGQISGLIAITRSMGGATGMTVSGVLLSQAAERLGRRLPEGGQPEVSSTETWGSSNSIEALQQATPEVRQLARDVLGGGVVDGWYFALGAAALGLVLAFRLRNPGD